MIPYIEIDNFRSIIHARINLHSLTVLVGANGSGKSNLVKAIEFLACIPRYGVWTAANRSGGFRALIPKFVSTQDIKRARMQFKYRVVLDHPKDYPPSFPSMAVEHSLAMFPRGSRGVGIAFEKLTFDEVLAFAKLNDNLSGTPTDYSHIPSPSHFSVERDESGRFTYDIMPPSSEHLFDYLDWLGLSFMKEGYPPNAKLEDLLAFIDNEFQKQEATASSEEKRHRSLIDSSVRTVTSLASQLRRFSSQLQSIKRYDLLLDELRAEQQFGDEDQLSSTGNNMPAVLRAIRSDKNAWNRILSTLGAIAPSVEEMVYNSLPTGREYVEFKESRLARAVKSWESSDGILRALAILLALETHPRSSTVLVEEPEQNLHPWAIRSVVDHIRQVMEERNLQVVITTHSPQVLERVYPQEVLVVSQSSEGGTMFRTLDETLPNTNIVMGEVADLWVKGLLGGVPAYD